MLRNIRAVLSLSRYYEVVCSAHKTNEDENRRQYNPKTKTETLSQVSPNVQVPFQCEQNLANLFKIVLHSMFSCEFSCRVGSNELMGCVAVGPRYIGLGRDHWFEMLENPRKPVAQWYPLLEHIPGISPNSDETPDSAASRSKKKARK